MYTHHLVVAVENEAFAQSTTITSGSRVRTLIILAGNIPRGGCRSGREANHLKLGGVRGQYWGYAEPKIFGGRKTYAIRSSIIKMS